jgi:hypothetical protein
MSTTYQTEKILLQTMVNKQAKKQTNKQKDGRRPATL